MAVIAHDPCRVSGAEKLRRLEELLEGNDLTEFIANARVERRGRGMRPREGNATYVTSLWSHYGDYPLDECRLLPPAQRKPAEHGFAVLRRMLPGRVLRGAYLADNQPFATPLFPEGTQFSPLAPGEARRGMLQRGRGVMSLPSRTIWLRPHGTPWKRDNEQDEKLERSALGEWREPRGDEMERAAELYNFLYREKYSKLNPQFTPRFLRELQDSEIVDFHGLYLHGTMMGVVGLYSVDRWMTATVLGYDTSISAEAGLYRRLAHRALKVAEGHGCNLHMSAGVGRFKSLRGARAATEWVWLRPKRFSVRLHFLRWVSGRLLDWGRRKGL